MTTGNAATKEELFARRLFEQMDESAWRISHCQTVERCCMSLAKGKKADKAILKQAAWLHDIGRTVADKDHASISAKLAEAEYGTLDPRLKDAIVNHGTEHRPATKEGKILQLADKLSVLSLESFIRDAKEDKEEALAFLQKMVGKIAQLVPTYEF